MKKLFFTAVALVAFSGVSLAENQIVIKINCGEVRLAAYCSALDNGATHEQAYTIAASAYNTCRLLNHP